MIFLALSREFKLPGQRATKLEVDDFSHFETLLLSQPPIALSCNISKSKQDLYLSLTTTQVTFPWSIVVEIIFNTIVQEQNKGRRKQR